MPRRLETTISDSLWAALHERAAQTGQPIRVIVHEALAEALDMRHHSLFQVSTSGAIVQGLYQGAVTVGELRRHGDLGLGTFESLDGEMILLDGHCYRAASDGSVIEVSDDAMSPFATVVQFVADETHELVDVRSFADLTERLDALRVTSNDFVAWRIHGVCAVLEVRAACRHDSGVPLVDAVADQAVFRYENTSASIVGFWSPEYAQAIAIAGYHLHAISDDRSRGGHVFDLQASILRVDVHRVTDLHLALPETEAFLAADLGGDTTQALDVAEHGTAKGDHE
jgi:acetolactate decarboxylase